MQLFLEIENNFWGFGLNIEDLLASFHTSMYLEFNNFEAALWDINAIIIKIIS